MYFILTIGSFYFGIKIANLYNTLKFTAFKNQLNNAIIEENIKKQYEKKVAVYEKKIFNLENKLTDLTMQFSEEE